MKQNKFALLALAVAAFAIGSTEFISVGLLPLLKNDFNVSLPVAGLTVSLYALGVTIGAPVLTTLSAKIKRKKLLQLVMIVFIAANLLAAFSPLFSILLAARIISAFSHGVFMSIATTIAADLVTPDKRSSAIALMFTGLTVATITGVPIGTFIGQQMGWQWSFIMIALVGFISLMAIVKLIPNTLTEPKITSISSQLVALKQPRLMMIYLITALGYGGTFVIYTYVTPLLKDYLGYSDNAIVIILIVYGVMVAIGNTLGGKFTDLNPTKGLLGIFVLQAASLIFVGLTTHLHVLGLIAILVMGLFMFMNVPGLQLLVVVLAEKYAGNAVSFASSLNISAFNIGIMIGALAGGYISNISLTYAPFVGLIMVSGAFVLMFLLHIKENSIVNNNNEMIEEENVYGNSSYVS